MSGGRKDSQVFAGLALAALFASSAVASTTDVILDLDGNPGCSQLVDNQLINETRDTDPPFVSGVDPITGAPIPTELVLNNYPDQCVWYTTSNGDTIDRFETGWCSGIAPYEGAKLWAVNMVVTKGGGSAGARVHHYGAAGVKADKDVIGPGTLKSVAFCTGLEGAVLVPETVTAGSCDEITNDSTDLDDVNGVAALCSSLDGDKAVVHVIRTDDQGIETVESCTCNDTAYSCDPDPAKAGLPGSCIQLPDYAAGMTDADKLLQQVPGVIKHANDGSFWCDDFNGTVSCFSFDAWGF